MKKRGSVNISLTIHLQPKPKKHFLANILKVLVIMAQLIKVPVIIDLNNQTEFTNRNNHGIQGREITKNTNTVENKNKDT
jgi:hypothetical protein